MQGICWYNSLNPVLTLFKGAFLLKTPISHGLTLAVEKSCKNTDLLSTSSDKKKVVKHQQCILKLSNLLFQTFTIGLNKPIA